MPFYVANTKKNSEGHKANHSMSFANQFRKSKKLQKDFEGLSSPRKSEETGLMQVGRTGLGTVDGNQLSVIYESGPPQVTEHWRSHLSSYIPIEGKSRFTPAITLAKRKPFFL